MELGHGEKAKKLFMEGYNCSQAVLGAFCDECGMDFESAFSSAVKMAQPGDCVLLSPACAAFDKFKNFMERGKYFKELVSRFE